MKMKRPKHIGDVILQVGSSLTNRNRINLVLYNKKWKSLVGKKIASVSRVIFINRKAGKWTLVIGVSDSIWLNELNYLKPQFMQKMSKDVFLSKFKNLRFVYDKKKDDFLEKNKSSKKKLSPEDLQKIEKKLEILNPPPKLRNFYFWVIKRRFEKNGKKV